MTKVSVNPIDVVSFFLNISKQKKPNRTRAWFDVRGGLPEGQEIGDIDTMRLICLFINTIIAIIISDLILSIFFITFLQYRVAVWSVNPMTL